MGSIEYTEVPDEKLISVGLDHQRLESAEQRSVCKELLEARLVLKAIATTARGSPNGNREGTIARNFLNGEEG